MVLDRGEIVMAVLWCYHSISLTNWGKPQAVSPRMTHLTEWISQIPNTKQKILAINQNVIK
jgi:hypothetical protein